MPKRPPPVKIEAGGAASAVRSSRPPAKKIKADPDAAASSSEIDIVLQQQFLAMFDEPDFVMGVSNSALKTRFGAEYAKLAPIINAFLKESRLSMSRSGGNSGELSYTLVSQEKASQMAGLDVSARLVYQVIETAGNLGIWTRDIKKETNLQDLALKKIFKTLETRRLIKQVKSVAAKAKKLYMLYDLSPSTEVTGGIWYSDLEFDHGFITELRTFLLHCVRKLQGGQGVTLPEILEKLQQANISKVNLGLQEVGQIMQTLVHDALVDPIVDEEAALAVDDNKPDVETTKYVAARRVSTMCEFKMWADALAPDFYFRSIRFEDGVTLDPLEPHYHS